VEHASVRLWVRVAFAFIGIFGIAFAVAGMIAPLPTPAAGGTCGPGTSSESPIVALFDPASIGAGAEPPATQSVARQQWKAFVDQCQTATDNRMVAAGVIVSVSLGLALIGPHLVLRSRRSGSVTSHPATPQPTTL
jgi:hypothetical protein